MKTPSRKVNFIPGGTLRALCALFVAAALGACSEDKTPPDDEGSADGKSQKISAFAESCASNAAKSAEFRACATGVIDAFSLSAAESEKLSGCQYASALPETSPVELHEQVRLNIRVNCED